MQYFLDILSTIFSFSQSAYIPISFGSFSVSISLWQLYMGQMIIYVGIWFLYSIFGGDD